MLCPHTPLPLPSPSWHNEPTDKSCQSWGNYDVNTQLFPDMAGFAQGLHAHGNVTGDPLKLSFNVHPQTGIDHCDSRYAAIATAMGVDPASNKTVACDFGNKTFADALFSIYYDNAPLHLVDVWWTDASTRPRSASQPTPAHSYPVATLNPTYTTTQYGGCGGPSSLLWSNWGVYPNPLPAAPNYCTRKLTLAPIPASTAARTP